MLRKSRPILFSTVVGLGIGLGLNRVSPGGPAFAQDTSNAAQSNRTSVQPAQAIALDKSLGNLLYRDRSNASLCERHRSEAGDD
jgi:hypothetical protein